MLKSLGVQNQEIIILGHYHPGFQVSKRKLLLVTRSEHICFNAGLDIHPANPKTVRNGLRQMFVQVKLNFCHTCPGCRVWKDALS